MTIRSIFFSLAALAAAAAVQPVWAQDSFRDVNREVAIRNALGKSAAQLPPRAKAEPVTADVNSQQQSEAGRQTLRAARSSAGNITTKASDVVRTR